MDAHYERALFQNQSVRWVSRRRKPPAIEKFIRALPMGEKILTKFYQSLLNHPDRVSGIILMVIASVAFIQALNLPFGSIRAPDAGFFPQSLSALLSIFAFGIFLNSLINRSEPAQFNSRFLHVVIAAAAFVAYALVLNKAGFVLATIFIMLLVMRGLSGMRWKQALLIAVPSVILTYLAFLQLGVPLPRGFLL